MNRTTRFYNLQAGESDLEVLVASDFDVHQFSEYHFRINGRLDVWPTSKKFYDRKSHLKGMYGVSLELFVKNHFKKLGL